MPGLTNAQRSFGTGSVQDQRYDERRNPFGGAPTGGMSFIGRPPLQSAWDRVFGDGGPQRGGAVGPALPGLRASATSQEPKYGGEQPAGAVPPMSRGGPGGSPARPSALPQQASYMQSMAPGFFGPPGFTPREGQRSGGGPRGAELIQRGEESYMDQERARRREIGRQNPWARRGGGGGAPPAPAGEREDKGTGEGQPRFEGVRTMDFQDSDRNGIDDRDESNVANSRPGSVEERVAQMLQSGDAAAAVVPPPAADAEAPASAESPAKMAAAVQAPSEDAFDYGNAHDRTDEQISWLRDNKPWKEDGRSTEQQFGNKRFPWEQAGADPNNWDQARRELWKARNYIPPAPGGEGGTGEAPPGGNPPMDEPPLTPPGDGNPPGTVVPPGGGGESPPDGGTPPGGGGEPTDPGTGGEGPGGEVPEDSRSTVVYEGTMNDIVNGSAPPKVKDVFGKDYEGPDLPDYRYWTKNGQPLVISGMYATTEELSQIHQNLPGQAAFNHLLNQAEEAAAALYEANNEPDGDQRGRLIADASGKLEMYSALLNRYGIVFDPFGQGEPGAGDPLLVEQNLPSGRFADRGIMQMFKELTKAGVPGTQIAGMIEAQMNKDLLERQFRQQQRGVNALDDAANMLRDDPNRAAMAGIAKNITDNPDPLSEREYQIMRGQAVSATDAAQERARAGLAQSFNARGLDPLAASGIANESSLEHSRSVANMLAGMEVDRALRRRSGQIEGMNANLMVSQLLGGEVEARQRVANALMGRADAPDNPMAGVHNMAANQEAQRVAARQLMDAQSADSSDPFAGTLAGASAGASFGPWGAAAGGLIGFLGSR